MIAERRSIGDGGRVSLITFSSGENDRLAGLVAIGHESLGVFAAFAGVALAADAVHGDGEVFVRFLADRAEAHRAGDEALDDLPGRLNLFKRDRLGQRS